MSKNAKLVDVSNLPAELQAQIAEAQKVREAEIPIKCEYLRVEFEKRCKEEGVTLTLVFNRGRTWSRKGDGSKKKKTEVAEAA